MNDLPASLGRAASWIVAAEEGELIYAGDFHRKVRERQTLWGASQQHGLNPQQYRQAKALVSSVSQQLAPARAVMAMLSRQAKPTQDRMSRAHAEEIPLPIDDIDIGVPGSPGGRSSNPKRFPARSAASLTGFRVDQAACALGDVAANTRADRAAALVIAKEAHSLLPPREFKARVAERLKLWQEAEERGLSEAEYLQEKVHRLPLAISASTPPAPPMKWKPVGSLGWRGPMADPKGLVGCATDWVDRMDSDEPMPQDLHSAARMLVAREAGRLLYPVDFALRAELRESLWEMAEELKLTPKEYRHTRDSMLMKPDHAKRLPRTKFEDLLREAHLAGPLAPSLESTSMPKPEVGQVTIRVHEDIEQPSTHIPKRKPRSGR